MKEGGRGGEREEGEEVRGRELRKGRGRMEGGRVEGMEGRKGREGGIDKEGVCTTEIGGRRMVGEHMYKGADGT